MEKSMKRVEKLVHATNSALAQMKFSLMFDDGLVGAGEKSGRRAEPFERGFSLGGGEDLRQCQDAFRAEANEMLTKMEKMFGSSDLNRKNWKPLDRIKEINRKMNAARQDHPKLRATEQSSEKLLSLIAEEKLSPQKTTPSVSFRPKAPPPPPKRETEPPEKPHRTPKKPHPLPPPATHSPVKSKEELKSNILETRDVVDRGFQTVRHLAQKVENMARKEKTPSLEKTGSEGDGRSESNETVKSGKNGRSGKSGRCPVAEEKTESPTGERHRNNTKVVDVRRRDSRRSRRTHLRVQRLPSLHIRGGLQLQKVHSLEIPSGGDTSCGKTNTGIHILSHEQIERAKVEKVLDVVRKENRCCEEVRGDAPGNCVECTNCGKVMRVQETWVDPRRLDEVLRKCRFNVFDPRIDEFVEKYGDACKWCERVEGGSAGEAEMAGGEKKEERKKSEERPKVCSLEDLSKRLSSRYRQEAEELESHHMRLNSLLKSLLRKIDESREVLEDCHLFRKGRLECERVLTRTEPVVVSLTGSAEGNASRRKRRLDKRDVKNRSKSRTKKDVEERPRKEKEERATWWADSRPRGRSRSRRELEEEKQKIQSPAASYSDRSCSSGQPEPPLGKGIIEDATELLSTGGRRDSLRRWEVREEGKASTPSSASSSRAGPMERDRSPEALLKREETERSEEGMSAGKALSEVSTDKSENNYESDFESVTNEPEEGRGDCEEAEAEAELVPGSKKLSTISEVDSELERKLSDEQKTHRGSPNSDGLPDDRPHLSNHQPNTLNTKHNNPSLTPDTSKTNTSLKSTPTELVTSLKEILSALKDQFARTETLAEKLTENVKETTDRTELLPRENSPSEDGVLSPWKMPAERLVENLRSARKESTGADSGGSRKDGMSADSLSDEGGSSLGEVIVGGQRRGDKGRGSPWLLSGRKEAAKLNDNSEEMSYSEGEIPSVMMLDSECCSSRSVGEVRD